MLTAFFAGGVFFMRAADLLTAFFAGGVCVLQAAETSGFGIDLGNGSGTAQEGWTNVTMPATASGGANTFVAVPLIRNGAASSSSSVAVGSLFGRLVSLTISARCSSGGSYTLAEPNTRRILRPPLPFLLRGKPSRPGAVPCRLWKFSRKRRLWWAGWSQIVR
ncbi:hypothetical protein, partial [Akkermansia muciniphila]|uniref:hypothetical protein n=1 Tax=Akkermansia muciniphila TaxID=239935 RepID=UPI001C9DC354